jgi:hypothetical protein
LLQLGRSARFAVVLYQKWGTAVGQVDIEHAKVFERRQKIIVGREFELSLAGLSSLKVNSAKASVLCSSSSAAVAR